MAGPTNLAGFGCCSDGGGGGDGVVSLLGCCPCATIPATLTVASTDPTLLAAYDWGSITVGTVLTWYATGAPTGYAAFGLPPGYWSSEFVGLYFGCALRVFISCAGGTVGLAITPYYNLDALCPDPESGDGGAVLGDLGVCEETTDANCCEAEPVGMWLNGLSPTITFEGS